MLIREAKENEFFLLKKQRLSSYRVYEEKLSSKQWAVLGTHLSSNIDHQPGVEVFIAEIDGQIVGSVALFPADSKSYAGTSQAIECSEIRMLAVNPDFRSHGIGKLLVEHCIDISKIRKQKFIGLYTGCFMKHAIALYEKIGFEQISSLDFSPLDDGITVKAFRCYL